MGYLVRQAAEMVGISRKTLYKHISSGKVSVTTDTDGNKLVDKSELLRVYGKLMETPMEQRVSPSEKARDLGARVAELEIEISKAKRLAETFKIHYESEKKRNDLLVLMVKDARKDKEIFRQMFDRMLTHEK